MKIGILTYHWVANFGANLQTLSTVNYFKKEGHTPYVINWVPADLEEIYKKNTYNDQLEKHLNFGKKHYNLTELCRNEEDISREIKKYSLDLIIIGSDAVLTYTPYLQRFILSRKGLLYFKPAIDSDFPNPFWGSFSEDVPNLPIVLMSASAQNTNYLLIKSIKRKRYFKSALEKFSYITVRDIWTKKMIQYLSNNTINPSITPDPVFAFNRNHDDYFTKSEIGCRFNLQGKYVLISSSYNSINEIWLRELELLFMNKGITLCELPKPQGSPGLNLNTKIQLPLSPLEWYYIIKFSDGYIGELMHPVLVSLHNSVPVFAIDNYGFLKDGVFDSDSSKTYQIMKRFDLLDKNYYSVLSNDAFPSPSNVVTAINQFDKDLCEENANKLYLEYEIMMQTITSIIK